MSATPRTDAQLLWHGEPAVNIEFARTLERELAQAKDALAFIRDNGGTTEPELGMKCSGTWCSEQACRALESIEGGK